MKKNRTKSRLAKRLLQSVSVQGSGSPLGTLHVNADALQY